MALSTVLLAPVAIVLGVLIGMDNISAPAVYGVFFSSLALYGLIAGRLEYRRAHRKI